MKLYNQLRFGIKQNLSLFWFTIFDDITSSNAVTSNVEDSFCCIIMEIQQNSLFAELSEKTNGFATALQSSTTFQKFV